MIAEIRRAVRSRNVARQAGDMIDMALLSWSTIPVRLGRTIVGEVRAGCAHSSNA